MKEYKKSMYDDKLRENITEELKTNKKLLKEEFKEKGCGGVGG